MGSSKTIGNDGRWVWLKKMAHQRTSSRFWKFVWSFVPPSQLVLHYIIILFGARLKEGGNVFFCLCLSFPVALQMLWRLSNGLCSFMVQQAVEDSFRILQETFEPSKGLAIYILTKSWASELNVRQKNSKKTSERFTKRMKTPNRRKPKKTLGKCRNPQNLENRRKL